MKLFSGTCPEAFILERIEFLAVLFTKIGIKTLSSKSGERAVGKAAKLPIQKRRLETSFMFG